jgi:hypothetical protein
LGGDARSSLKISPVLPIIELQGGILYPWIYLEIMRTALRTFIVVGLVAGGLALLPSLASGGKFGELLAKDTGDGKSAIAVIPYTDVQNPKQLTLVVTSKPNHRVDWLYTTNCYKDGVPHLWPLPGQLEDISGVTPIRKKMRMRVKDPDYCTVQASAKLDYNSAKSVTTKIYSK